MNAADPAEKERYRMHAEVLHVLSNPVRHEIVHRLTEGRRTPGELVAATGASNSAVSQHLALLKSYGLVTSSRDGRSVHFELAYPELATVCSLIDEILLDQARRSLSVHTTR